VVTGTMPELTFSQSYTFAERNNFKVFVKWWSGLNTAVLVATLGHFVFFHRIEFTYALLDVDQMVIDYWQKCEMQATTFLFISIRSLLHFVSSVGCSRIRFIVDHLFLLVGKLDHVFQNIHAMAQVDSLDVCLPTYVCFTSQTRDISKHVFCL